MRGGYYVLDCLRHQNVRANIMPALYRLVIREKLKLASELLAMCILGM